jgi:hypothetical protein
MSQIGDFMAVSLPCGRLLVLLVPGMNGARFDDASPSWAPKPSGFAMPGLARRRQENAMRQESSLAHSAWQNMQPGTAVLSLALSRRG